MISALGIAIGEILNKSDRSSGGRQLGMAQLQVQQALHLYCCQQHSVAQQGCVASHGAGIPKDGGNDQYLLEDYACLQDTSVLTDKSYLEAQDTLYISFCQSLFQAGTFNELC